MNQFCEITPELRRLAAKSAECSKIDPELYTRYDVKRGLRDLNGKGVLVGLTEISEVSSTKIVNGESVPADGELFFDGENIYLFVCLIHGYQGGEDQLMMIVVEHFGA